MGKENLTYWDYVKAAFNWKTRLPVLGPMPCNKLLLAGFAILGFGHPGFWLLGAAWEAFWLLFLPGNPRFQTLVRGMQLTQTAQTWSNREQDLLGTLDRSAQYRYAQLADRCRRIASPEGGASVAASMEELKAGDLKTLLWIFLNLLVSQKKIHEVLERTSREDLAQEITGINKNMEKETEGSPVWRSLKGILEIQQRRLDNVTKFNESLKVTEAELYRIEKQICLIQEEVAVSRDPELLSARLDGVVKSLEGTTQWMNENAQFFKSLEDEPPATLPGLDSPMPATPPPLPPAKGRGGPGKVAQ